MNQVGFQPSSRGKWLVIALVLIGISAALIASSYWRTITTVPPAGDGGAASSSGGFDLDAARERLDALEQAFAERREQGDATAILEPALAFVHDYPAFSGAHRLMGQVYLDLAESNRALESFERSLELNPNQPNVHQLAGHVALINDDLDAASRHYAQAVALDPRNGRYRLHIADIALRRGEFDDARKQLLQALALDSSLHEAHSALSDLYARENKLPLALQQIQKAIELVGESQRRPWVTYTRKKASLLRRDNQPVAALRVLETLRASERIEPAVMNEVAACLGQMNQPRRAAEMYEQALIVLPLDADLVIGATEWQIRAGNLDRAREHVHVLETINSNHPAIARLRQGIQSANP
jgi:tetratricopeptide (TPR) repeat protein